MSLAKLIWYASECLGRVKVTGLHLDVLNANGWAFTLVFEARELVF